MICNRQYGPGKSCQRLYGQPPFHGFSKSERDAGIVVISLSVPGSLVSQVNQKVCLWLHSIQCWITPRLSHVLEGR